MNKRIKELAKQAGFVLFSSEERLGEPIDWSCDYTQELEKFAELIRADEREACAKVCDELAAKDKLSNYYGVAARAIRARGNHD